LETNFNLGQPDLQQAP